MSIRQSIPCKRGSETFSLSVSLEIANLFCNGLAFPLWQVVRNYSENDFSQLLVEATQELGKLAIGKIVIQTLRNNHADVF